MFKGTRISFPSTDYFIYCVQFSWSLDNLWKSLILDFLLLFFNQDPDQGKKNWIRIRPSWENRTRGPVLSNSNLSNIIWLLDGQITMLRAKRYCDLFKAFFDIIGNCKMVKNVHFSRQALMRAHDILINRSIKEPCCNPAYIFPRWLSINWLFMATQ